MEGMQANNIIMLLSLISMVYPYGGGNTISILKKNYNFKNEI